MALSEEKLQFIENQIRQRSIPYDYDTKEYPIEVIDLKFSPRNGEEATMFIPTYQRALVWDNKRQMKFIESLFLGVPIPPIFVAVMEETGNLEIIDGSQRIRTIARYVNDSLALSGLEEIDSLNETKFSELTPSRRRKFLNIAVRFHVITDKADLAVRADIFDRLNSNVKVLVPSEIRKGAFASSNFYQFVLQISQSAQFTQLLPPHFRNEEREELTLRFFAYSETYSDFKHDVAIFLNRYVEKKEEDGFNANDLTAQFERMLTFVARHFPTGFLKTLNSSQVPRVRFEAISVGTHLALEENENLIPQSMNWLSSKQFKKHTTSDASNNRLKLAGRIEFVRDCLLSRITDAQLNY